jgi:hypothetical protein
MFECSVSSFSSAYAINDTKITSEKDFKLKSTLNEALEIKLKEYSNQVMKYALKIKKSENAMLEFIMDSRGLLYLSKFYYLISLTLRYSRPS